YSAIRRPFSTSATPPVSVDVSRPSTRIAAARLLPRPPQRGHPGRGVVAQRPEGDAPGPGAAGFGVHRLDDDFQPLRRQLLPHPAPRTPPLPGAGRRPSGTKARLLHTRE